MAFFGLKLLGARALVIRNDEVLLVKHSYCKGWYTIGGIIEAKENPIQSITRELFEEVGITIQSPPTLFGFYHGYIQGCDNYIALYLVKDFRMQEVHSFEIQKKAWFKLDNLPLDTTPATRTRIREYLGQQNISDVW